MIKVNFFLAHGRRLYVAIFRMRYSQRQGRNHYCIEHASWLKMYSFAIEVQVSRP